MFPVLVVRLAMVATARQTGVMGDAEPSGADESDWFGLPLHQQRIAVPCPQCGATFSDAAAFGVHASQSHGLKTQSPARPHRPRTARVRRAWVSLGFLPLWFVLPVTVLIVGITVAVVWPVNPWWALYAGGLSSFPLVLVLSHRIFHGR